MREILFRGWNATEECWHSGFITEKRDIHFIYHGSSNMFIPVETQTIGQYIGIKDLKSDRVFSDDIAVVTLSFFEAGDYVEREYIGVIAYSEKLLSYVLCDSNGGIVLSLNDMLAVSSDGCCDNIEVIGNVHENPELLPLKIELSESQIERISEIMKNDKGGKFELLDDLK